MDTQPTTFTPEEGFQTIQRMIANAQKRIGDNGFDYLFWGSAAIMCSLVNYYLLRTNYENPFIAWALMPLLVPVSLVYHRQRKKEVAAKSHFEQVYKILWLGFGITLGVVIFLSISMGVSPYPFLMALIGITTFTAGSIIRFTPLQWGSAVFWAGAVMSALSGVETQCLIYAGAIFAGYILPGISLTKRAKQ